MEVDIMCIEKKAVYNGNTYIVKNIIPDITENERKFVIQNISDELVRVFRRGM